MACPTSHVARLLRVTSRCLRTPAVVKIPIAGKLAIIMDCVKPASGRCYPCRFRTSHTRIISFEVDYWILDFEVLVRNKVVSLFPITLHIYFLYDCGR